MTTFAKGDTVRITADLKVSYVNGNGKLDLSFPAGDEIEFVPADCVALVRRAPVAEPAVGTMISYKGAFGGNTYNYIRTSSGWQVVGNDGAPTGSTYTWNRFESTRVTLYVKAPTTLVPAA